LHGEVISIAGRAGISLTT
jgi:hypothetical protein